MDLLAIAVKINTIDCQTKHFQNRKSAYGKKILKSIMQGCLFEWSMELVTIKGLYHPDR